MNRVKTVIFILLAFFSSLFFLSDCKTKKKDSTQADIITFLLSNTAGSGGACQRMIQNENLCVTSPANPLVVCNADFTNAILNNIQPESKRTDSLLEKYIKCFDTCNLSWNILSSCQNSKFASNSIYRNEQRALNRLVTERTPAMIQWIDCYESCRSINGKIPPKDSGLIDTGTSFPEDWYKGN